ncbi:MAG TPA: TonB-dependent receptor [Longimicrobium sp.]
MMMINRLLATLLLALTLAPAASAAQAVQGRLIGRESQAPVRGGTVHLMAADSQVVGQARTDSAGRFTLQAPRPGRYWLLGSAPGYDESETDLFAVEAQGTRVSFVIGRAAVVLDTVTAAATSVGDADRLWYGGFHQRMRENQGGRFITREQIDRQRHIQLADVLRQVPGLDVQVGARSDFSDSRLMRVRLRQPLSFRDCWSIFYLNGMRVESESVQGLNPAEIEGVEIYTNGVVPAQFNSSMGAACGVIVIWTQARG